MRSSIENWIIQISKEMSMRKVAAKAEIPQPTMHRQLVANAVTPENVLKIARAYQAPPLEGLVASGFLSSTEASSMGVEDAIKKATDQQLAKEILRRVEESPSAHSVLTEPNNNRSL